VFIMATTEEHKVPETIASRCQLFEFRTIATAKIAERLKLIAKAEKISISEEALREIARSGDGSMRDAQSAFDQVISFAGEKIKTGDVEKALGIAGADVLSRVVSGIAENKPAEALAIVDDLVMRGHNPAKKGDDKSKQVKGALAGQIIGGLVVSPTSGEATEESVQPIRMDGGGLGRDPAAKRLTGQQRSLRADGVEDGEQVIDVVGDLQRMAGLVGVAVTEHVDRPRREVFGVRLEIADVGLGMAAGSVQQHQRSLIRVAGENDVVGWQSTRRMAGNMALGCVLSEHGRFDFIQRTGSAG